jgi:putative nucleotidyltransferase with HDIG domain
LIAAGFTLWLYSINLSPLLALAILYAYAKFIKKIENLPPSIDFLLLVGLIMIVFLAISLFLTPIFFSNLALVNLNILKFSALGISAIGFSMIIAVLFDNLELSLMFSIFMSIFSATMEGENFGTGTAIFCASLSAAMASYRLRRRSQIVKAAFFSSLVFFIAFMLENSDNLFIMSQKFALSTLLIGGVSFGITIVLLPIIVTGVLYIFEYVFKVVTNISLLELSDSNHPLLKTMILEAPGTYQHSLVVANLSEAAAESIGANSLLARVGAYYHDIGKINKPHYFIENQIGYHDGHKDLKPSMSKLIIINHVKDGVDLANKYRLNPRIIDFIMQHHGRSVVQYFYHRAKELECENYQDEEEYRYPGPKPQNKETAIVALADSIEASSRTLDEPNPSRIEETVKEIIRARLADGELDESRLTLKDLEKISQSFIRTLNALFHARINYPTTQH